MVLWARVLATASVVVIVAVALLLSRSHSSPRAPAPRAVTNTHTSKRPHRVTRARTAKHPSLVRLLGETIVGRFYGTQPSPEFLERIRAGEVGAVILYGENTVGGLASVRAIDERMQAQARAGSNPPLLIMTDQEGGPIRRLPGPPAMAPAEMTSVALARREGLETALLLRSVGVSVDLAPVADVEQPNGDSFLGSRSFGSDPTTVASKACAFARGLAAGGVAYTLKHFPGLGLARVSTDAAPVAIEAPAAELRSSYQPYRECGSSPLALVMIDSASYPSLSGSLPAVLSPEIYASELAGAVRRTATLTISDNLETPALAAISAPGPRALAAGLDLAMYATSESGSAEGLREMLAAVRDGQLSRRRVRSAAARVEALKHILD
jgi:beta-N-acetylhexosaminidase